VLTICVPAQGMRSIGKIGADSRGPKQRFPGRSRNKSPAEAGLMVGNMDLAAARCAGINVPYLAPLEGACPRGCPILDLPEVCL
jgi:hypothetical protein